MSSQEGRLAEVEDWPKLPGAIKEMWYRVSGYDQVSLLKQEDFRVARGSQHRKYRSSLAAEVVPGVDVLPTLEVTMDLTVAVFSAPLEKSVKLFEASMEFISTAFVLFVISGINK